MIDEGELRSRFPEITWDEPVTVTVLLHESVWACRYCIAMQGLAAQEIVGGTAMTWATRKGVLDHIEALHHD